MIKRRFLLIVFVSGLFSASAAYAFAPPIIWIGRTLATVALESIVVEGVTRGLAATDPYVKNRITVPTKNIPAAFKKTKGWLNPYWFAFATAAGLLLEGDEFKQMLPEDEFIYLVCNTVTFGPPGDSVVAPCAYSSSDSRFLSVDRIERASPNDPPVSVDFGSQIGLIPSHQVFIHYFSETTWNPDYFYFDGVWRKGDSADRYVLGYVSAEPHPAGTTKRDISDEQVALLASAYLASDNRPADAFMDASGKPIPELLENAVIEPVPNVDADTLTDLAAYRAGLLQTTNPAADHYVTPERLEEIKKLAAQQDAANTPEGELDALNEKIKQPITQAQYEESNLKTETANASSLSTALANISPPLDQLKLDNDFVLDKVASPSEPPSGVDFFKWTLPTGSCSGFSVDMSVGNGKLHTSKMVNEFCPFYESVAHPLLFWFLNIATFLYLFWLWDRSVSDMAR